MLDNIQDHSTPLTPTVKPIERSQIPSGREIEQQVRFYEYLHYGSREAGYPEFFEAFKKVVVEECEDKNVVNAPYFEYLARVYWIRAYAYDVPLDAFDDELYDCLLESIKNRRVVDEACEYSDEDDVDRGSCRMSEWCTEETFWAFMAHIQNMSDHEVSPYDAVPIIRSLCWNIACRSNHVRTAKELIRKETKLSLRVRRVADGRKRKKRSGKKNQGAAK
jgi:hypothetical protein